MIERLDGLHPAAWERSKKIRLCALAEAPDAFGSTLAREKRFLEKDWKQRLARPDAATFIARAPDGTDCGMAVGAPYGNTAGLFAMWVDPRHRGQGLGKALVTAVLAWAKNAGYAEIRLDVGKENAPAIAFYRACGFQPNGVTGTLPPPRTHIAEIQMTRTL